MTDALVDVEWIGGPLDGRITRHVRDDLRVGMIAWHEEAGVRNNYVLSCQPGLVLVNVIVPDRCCWTFKSRECGYVGAARECDKSYERCERLGRAHAFGGFPGPAKPGPMTNDRWTYRHVRRQRG